MTPLYRFFDHFLPSWLAYGVLAACYAGMMAALLFFDGPSGEAIVYIDIRG